MSNFIWSIHYLRAFAIINIVFIHVWRIPNSSTNDITMVDAWREILFHNSSIYFVFISGFLFKHLTKRNYLLKFYRGKLKNLIVPYLVISIALLVLFYFIPNPYHVNPLNLENFLSNLLYGTTMPHLWYIPFILSVFVFCPLLLWIPNKILSQIGWLVLLFPILGTRTATLTPGLYLFLVPIFIFGMFASLQFDSILKKIRAYRNILIIGGVLATVLLFFLYTKNLVFEQYQKNIFESVSYAQKMFFLGIAILYFEKFKKNDLVSLDYIAKTSFAIYFLHYPVARAIQPVYFKLVEGLKINVILFLTSLLFSLVVFGITIVIIEITKRIFGKASGFLIGY